MTLGPLTHLCKLPSSQLTSLPAVGQELMDNCTAFQEWTASLVFPSGCGLMTLNGAQAAGGRGLPWREISPFSSCGHLLQSHSLGETLEDVIRAVPSVNRGGPSRGSHGPSRGSCPSENTRSTLPPWKPTPHFLLMTISKSSTPQAFAGPGTHICSELC